MPALNQLLRTSISSVFCAALFALAAATPGIGPVFATEVPDELKGVGITEHPGESVLVEELKFRNEAGAVVPLSSYFNRGKPVVLVLAYYECPNLCTFVLNGLTESMRQIRDAKWVPGKQFDVVTVSINPKETAELAARKKAAYLKSYGSPNAEEAAAGWHFLTGEETQIRKLAETVGFGYKWDPAEKQYAHSAAIFALTPDGRISRTLYGIEYKPNDVKLALLEASNGKIGTVIERFLLFCYRYDPKTRKYSIYLTKLMQAGGASTVLVFGGYMAIFWRRQRRDSRNSKRNSKKEEPHTHV